MHWRRFLDLLVLFDGSWAASASALAVMISNSLMRPPGADADVPSPTRSFDAGAASGYFALQASLMGWHVHGMAGFDHERAFVELDVPAGHRVEAAYAAGRRGDAAVTPRASAGQGASQPSPAIGGARLRRILQHVKPTMSALPHLALHSRWSPGLKRFGRRSAVLTVRRLGSRWVPSSSPPP